MSGVWAGEDVIALLTEAVRAAGRREAIVAKVVGRVSWRRLYLEPQGRKRTGEGVETG